MGGGEGRGNDTQPQVDKKLNCRPTMQRFNPSKPEFTIGHLHPPQAADCSRNFRLLVVEDDLKWVANENKYIVINIKKVPYKFSF